MPSRQTVFSQLLSQLSHYDFTTCVQRYDGNHKIKHFSCWSQFVAMAFAQLTFRESLRDIEICLRTNRTRLYHLGLRSAVARNTLANANARRDWRIYADFAQLVIARARTICADSDDPLIASLDRAIYALDSSVIDLGRHLMPWARYKRTQAAIKLHTLFDLASAIPAVAVITPARINDTTMLDHLAPLPGAVYILDRGYVDFRRLYRLHCGLSRFIVRSRANIHFAVRHRRPLDPQNELTIASDQIVALTGTQTPGFYPDLLRRIRALDPVSQTGVALFTDLLEPPAAVIAELYRRRWQVELFFRWIKQHLRIKAFYGRSENAVKTQIWIAITVYVLLAMARKEYGIHASMHTLLQYLSLGLMAQVPLAEALAQAAISEPLDPDAKQLILWD